MRVALGGYSANYARLLSTNQIRMNELCTDANHFMGELCGVVPFLGTAENS